MEMKKIACAVIFAAASVSAVMAQEQSQAPAPAPASGASASVPVLEFVTKIEYRDTIQHLVMKDNIL
ncbi:hypothetical protein FEM48_Zijuj05G0008700 [Ziziphus jujuba var. spinosa]|uniref:Uncharacterized protein n=1 Tax=Ziziphus jujuba var. spinosa TaxID=714518 RepID=A0A978VBU7_ZIZJJ|nr:hypothetical protein FEM48_Zijuj05G0008700 [Ziziphus jujuba var. spinosa]